MKKSSSYVFRKMIFLHKITLLKLLWQINWIEENKKVMYSVWLQYWYLSGSACSVDPAGIEAGCSTLTTTTSAGATHLPALLWWVSTGVYRIKTNMAPSKKTWRWRNCWVYEPWEVAGGSYPLSRMGHYPSAPLYLPLYFRI